jgi:hypothetical protein
MNEWKSVLNSVLILNSARGKKLGPDNGTVPNSARENNRGPGKSYIISCSKWSDTDRIYWVTAA